MAMMGKIVNDSRKVGTSMAPRKNKTIKDYATQNKSYKTQEPSPHREAALRLKMFGLELTEVSTLGNLKRYRCRLTVEPKYFFERLIPILNMHMENVMFSKEFILKDGELKHAVTVLLPAKKGMRNSILNQMSQIGINDLVEVESVPLGHIGANMNKPADGSEEFVPMHSGKGAYAVKTKSKG